jgi:hypothetical protein
MKLTMSRKIFSILIVLFFVCLFGGLYLLVKDEKFTFLSGAQTDMLFNPFLEYCEVEEDLSVKKISCKAFITSERVIEGGGVCFDILIYPGIYKVLQEAELCDNKSLIDWENPYINYSRYVPVNLELEIGENLFGKNRLKAGSISLMEEEEVYDFRDVYPTSIPIWLDPDEVIHQGDFYLFKSEGSEQEDTLHVREVTVYNIERDNDELVLYFGMIINGEELKVKEKISDFFFMEEIQELGDDRKLDFVGVDNFNLFNYEGTLQGTLKFSLEEGFSLRDYLDSQEGSEEYVELIPNLESLLLIRNE